MSDSHQKHHIAITNAIRILSDAINRIDEKLDSIEWDAMKEDRDFMQRSFERSEYERNKLKSQNTILREALERIADMSEVDMDTAPQYAKQALNKAGGGE